MTKSLLKKGLWVPLVLLVALCVVVTAMAHSATFAYAEEESGLAFDKTDVVDDLKSATIDGKVFNINDYPYNKAGKLRMVTFIEYAYSFRQDQMDNYGLYVYIYNPSKETIDVGRCYISMDVDGDSHKFVLDYINQSTGSFDKLFYKFKVRDVEVNGTTFKDRVNPNYRRYAISEVEITEGKNAYNATSLGVSHEYVFTGYSQGYGADKTAESTLKSSSSSIETVELLVNHTTFRTNMSSKGNGYYNQVSTAWFTISDDFWCDYDYLSAITAMWYEYQTKYMLVTNSEELYGAMFNLRKTTLSEFNASYPSLYYGMTRVNDKETSYEWVYNLNKASGFYYTNYSKVYCNSIPFVFKSEAPSESWFYKLFKSGLSSGDVESTEIAKYITDYSKNSTDKLADVKNGGKIASALFEDNTVDEGRIRGYNKVTTTLEDKFNLSSYKSNHSDWDAFLDFGIRKPELGGDYQDVLPIYEVTASDLALSDEDFSKQLLVHEDDVSKIREAYNTAVKNGERVILYRFAVTDYFSRKVITHGVDEWALGYNVDAYIAKETVFFDFDILSLTFSRDGQDFVIPAVASPVDVIGKIEPPAEEGNGNSLSDWLKELLEKLGDKEWWNKVLDVLKKVGIGLACALGVVVLIMILPPIFKGIAGLINVTKSSIELKTAKKEAKAQSKSNNSKKHRVRNRSNNKK